MRTTCAINLTLLTLSLAAAAAAGTTSNRTHFLSFLLVLLLPPVSSLLHLLLSTYLVPGGSAWRGVPGSASRPRSPCGWPILGRAPTLRDSLAHRKLAALAWTSSDKACRCIMPLSLGPSTRAIVASDPATAREVLHSPAFADRPTKLAAQMLTFDRAVGFAPSGEKWRRLRRAAVGRAFSPRAVAAQEETRSRVGEGMVGMIKERAGDEVEVREVLRWGAVEGAVAAVLGDGGWVSEGEKREIGEMVREAYGVMDWWGFGWEEYYLPEMVGGMVVELSGMGKSCRRLMERVRTVLGGIVDKRRKMVVVARKRGEDQIQESDLLGVLLDCSEEEMLTDTDLVAVLWEMIFRAADVVAILMEWVLARMVLHADVQRKAQQEIYTHVGTSRAVRGRDIPCLRYLQAVVKETLRLHPPGPLMSWARLAIYDTRVGKVFVPAGTIAVVNMWAIAHDEAVWKDPWVFRPERFLELEEAGDPISVTGSDLRLAPFGSGRRVCPGKVLGLADVQLWLGRLLQQYRWLPTQAVGLEERLRMSLEMKKPLVCGVVPMQE